MKTFTIRGIDEELDTRLKRSAREKSLSINQWILRVLKQATGLNKSLIHTRKYHDLDHLFGTWTEKEYAEFQTTQKTFERIDRELWQ